MNKLVSIIIPVYNTEKFLGECLESIIKQNYKNIEIILIDDGSTDSSGKICMEYMEKDSRIIVIRQKNSGVSCARNRGLEIANGEFVLFVDSDDFVQKNYVKELYDKIQKYDIAICGIGRFINGKKKNSFLEQQEMNRDDLIIQTLESKFIGGYPVNKIFKKSIIDRFNIKFNENIHIGEDMIWILEYLNHCEKGIYISEILYYYRLNDDSMLQSSIRHKEFNKKNLEVLVVDEILRDTITFVNKDVQNALAYRYIRSDMRLLFNMITCKYADKKTFRVITMHTRRNIFYFLKNRIPTKLEKLVSVSMCLSTRITYSLGIIGNLIFNKYLDSYLE